MSAKPGKLNLGSLSQRQPILNHVASSHVGDVNEGGGIRHAPARGRSHGGGTVRVAERMTAHAANLTLDPLNDSPMKGGAQCRRKRYEESSIA